ncbi:MAG: hypothetical protein GF353_22735, partial [Candidatus Lokiarchaeota archaeon]|nr:hypothetical protein [Candidatus Lokiarchaeota archaeon]
MSLIYQISKFLDLRYNGKLTNIFVNNEKFKQCKNVVINISKGDISNLESINSVDELIYKLEGSLNKDFNNFDIKINPIEEFWVYCSNLQAWYENNYDTNMLSADLSFPLLKKLSDLGDKSALKVFKEEIAKRFLSGFKPIIKFLILEKYYTYLSREEIKFIFEKIKELDLKKCDLKKIPYFTLFNNNSLTHLDLSRNSIASIPKRIKYLQDLLYLNLFKNKLVFLPNEIILLKGLR